MLVRQCKSLLPGVSITTIVGMAALFLSSHYSTPVMLFALLLGIAVSFLYEETSCRAGIDAVASYFLKIGVALIGLRLALSDITSLGIGAASVLITAVATTILLGFVLSKMTKLPPELGVLTGGAVGICGASAALAISAALPNYQSKQRDTALTVIGVTLFSTIAMIVYPSVTQQLGLTESQSSFFFGGTIHDVAQVVGAGYSVSDATGDQATLIKLIRVSLLVPVVLALIFSFKSRKASVSKQPILPWFLIAFIVLMLTNTLVDIPNNVANFGAQVSRFCLILAITAIGMKSNLRQLLEVGARPVLILAAETLWIAGFILFSLKFLEV